MIKSYGDASTARFAETGKSKFSGMDITKADKLLMMLTSLKDLGECSKTGRYRLHSLSGNWKGFWSIDINGPWRMFFRFNGDVHELTIIDPH
jgi:proteic killer suppression protein